MRINNLCIICISTVLILLNSAVVAQENMIQQPCYTIGTVENGLTGTAFNYAHVVGSATKSFGVGDGVYVWSPYSVSLGRNNSIANYSDYSLAFGKDNQIHQYTPYSIAIGSDNIIQKISQNTTEYSTLIGHDNYAKNEYVIGVGTGNTLNGANSAAFGNKIETGGNADYSIGIGYMANVADPYSIAMGSNSEIPAIYILGSSSISEVGKIGIATSTPKADFDVNGDIRVSGESKALLFAKDEASYNNQWGLKMYNGGGLTIFQPGANGNPDLHRLVIDDETGNIGVGTEEPEVKLHVNGSVRVMALETSNISSTIKRITLTDGKGNIEASENLLINDNKAIGIGLSGTSEIGNFATNYNDAKLYVNGGIMATELWVKLLTEWSDFVFADNYKLRPLHEVESYIKEHKHLPDIPSAGEVAEEGINVGQMDAKLLQKIEELTLYVIKQQKQIDEQQKLIIRQQEDLNKLSEKIAN